MIYRGYTIGPRMRFIQLGTGRGNVRVYYGHEFTDSDGYTRIAGTVAEAKLRIDALEGGAS